jgi:hypothetical protein
MKIFFILIFSFGLVLTFSCSDGTIPTATEPLVELKATYVTQRPVLDGLTDESIWQSSKPFFVHVGPVDGVGKEYNIVFKAIWWKEWAQIAGEWDDRAYLGMTISWPDEQKDTEKYQWSYSADQEKWIRSNKQSDWLLLQWYSNSEYNDIWYWDSALTNPLGYAEDEYMLISNIDSVISASLWIDGLNYLNDTADEQNTWDLNYDDNLTPRDSTDDRPLWAWQNKVEDMELTRPRIQSNDPLNNWLFKKDSDFLKNTPYLQADATTRIPGFALEEPVSDAADIMAAGRWKDGMWTVELVRVAATLNPNDVAFSPDDRYYQQPFFIAVGDNAKNPVESANSSVILSQNAVVLSFEYLAPGSN